MKKFPTKEAFASRSSFKGSKWRVLTLTLVFLFYSVLRYLKGKGCLFQREWGYINLEASWPRPSLSHLPSQFLSGGDRIYNLDACWQTLLILGASSVVYEFEILSKSGKKSILYRLHVALKVSRCGRVKFKSFSKLLISKRLSNISSL